MSKKKAREDLLVSFLNEKWKNKKCMMCGANSWAFVTDASVTVGSARNLPLAVASCGNCGLTLLVSQKIAGLS